MTTLYITSLDAGFLGLENELLKKVMLADIPRHT